LLSCSEPKLGVFGKKDTSLEDREEKEPESESSPWRLGGWRVTVRTGGSKGAFDSHTSKVERLESKNWRDSAEGSPRG